MGLFVPAMEDGFLYSICKPLMYSELVMAKYRCDAMHTFTGSVGNSKHRVYHRCRDSGEIQEKQTTNSQTEGKWNDVFDRALCMGECYCGFLNQ